uniref:Tetraspanin family n=1 Tax=Schistocephalus solidus TaxID=70667 RepID=A0A0X3Q5E3_SCHSO
MASALCYKILLGVVCVFHLAIGITFIVFGSQQSEFTSQFNNNSALNVQRMLIGLGVVLLLLAILPAIGLISGNRHVVYLFLGLSIVAGIVHLGLGSYILVVKSHMNELVDSPALDNVHIDQSVMDELQSTVSKFY